MKRNLDAILRSVAVRPDRSRDRNTYPFDIAAIRHLGTLEFNPRVTFFVGENGSGKSTLLEAIAIAAGYNAEGGTKNFRVKTRPSESILHGCIRLARGSRRERTGFFFRAESFFNVATEAEELGALGSYGGRSLHEQSHGESFLSLIQNRFGDQGLYLLDEPEAALSPTRQLAFLVRVDELVNAGSQFIIASHSPIITAFTGATIYVFDGEGVRVTSYRDTEQYNVTRAIVSNPEGFMDRLLKDARR